MNSSNPHSPLLADAPVAMPAAISVEPTPVENMFTAP